MGVYLRTCSTILDLAGVETLLVEVLHAGEHARATEAHWIDGTLLVERHSVCDDLNENANKRTNVHCMLLCSGLRHYQTSG